VRAGAGRSGRRQFRGMVVLSMPVVQGAASVVMGFVGLKFKDWLGRAVYCKKGRSVVAIGMLYVVDCAPRLCDHIDRGLIGREIQWHS